MKNIFKTNYKVTVGDINYGGHMGNERALIVFQQTRIDWLKSFGYDETNILGKGIIQLESHIYYTKEIHLNDNLLCKIISIEIEKMTFNIFYEIFNEKNEIALKGSTKMAIFDYEKRKISKIPQEFLEKIF